VFWAEGEGQDEECLSAGGLHVTGGAFHDLQQRAIEDVLDDIRGGGGSADI
jgi:hypothetical protein